MQGFILPSIDILSSEKLVSKNEYVKIVKIKNFDGSLLGKEQVSSVIGGYLVQETFLSESNEEEFQIVTKRKPSKKEFNNLVFLWKIVKHVKSNAIVVGTKFNVLGVGTGQTNRVGSVKLAINGIKNLQKNKKQNSSDHSIGLASDAFFPFPDSIKMASRNGISCVIQPGGSIKDSDVIRVADSLNISMVFTRRRLFSH